MVGCWRGYLSGARCRLAYCPADATANCHSLSLASVKSRLIVPFWCQLTRVVPDKGPLSGCVHACVCMINVTHTHPFNGPLSGTTRVSWYQKGTINLDFTEARVSEWQWHQLGHMQAFTLLQTDNHASTHHSVFYRPDALPATQPTASKH